MCVKLPGAQLLTVVHVLMFCFLACTRVVVWKCVGMSYSVGSILCAYGF